MKKGKLIRYASILLFILFCVESAPLYAASMEDYCIIPPYVKRDVSVNIMILLDNSEDMLGPAYTDTTYCPDRPIGNTNCWDGTKYYKEYLGHFPPTACYTPGTKFQYAGHKVDYTANPDTGCPASEFNGNVLNWATMSRISIAKKVLTGEASNSTSVSFAIEGRKSFWDLVFHTGYRTSDGCKWTITSSSGDDLLLDVTEPGAPGSCKYPKTGGPWDVKIDPTTGIEVRRGVLQDFTDTVNNTTLKPPPDGSFDKGAARFGLTKFKNVAGTTEVSIEVPIPPTGVYSSFINKFNSSLGTNAFNDLASAHYTDDVYFSAPPNESQDPYKGCASWESPCTQGVAVPCRKSAILMLTTGTDVSGIKVSSPPLPNPLPSECSATETRPLVWNACYAYNTDLRTAADLPAKQNISTYVIRTFGTGASNCQSVSGATGCVTGNESADCKIKTLCDTAAQGGGNYYSAGTGDLEEKIRAALQDIIKRAAAGTAASVLASGEGQGANLIQAVFYPRKKFYNSTTLSYDEIAWNGRLTNFWYYVDPFFTCSNIREDTVKESPYSKLNLIDDDIIQLYFDTSTETTKARRWQDTDGDGCANGSKLATDIELEKLGNLWEAGLELWKRPVKPWDPSDTANNRTIKTTTGSGFIDFSINNKTTLKDYLQAGSDAEAESIIRYIHGEDTQTGGNFANSPVAGFNPDYRSRTAAVDLNGDGTLDPGEEAKVWKLADILNSTPRISSWIQLNNYDSKYTDSTYTSFIGSSNYTSRGMVFAGANDGMLHAFKLGSLNLPSHNSATPTCSFGSKDAACLSGTELGKEVWAFIPKNALPYLKYLTDSGYCHVYTVDLTPYIFDASINGNPDVDRTVNSWRTVLIGGMRLGGACKPMNSNCSTDTPNSVCAPAAVSGTSVGFSSYFALDITDQNNPTLLWEFSHEDLGFSTTAPTIVRISAIDPATGNHSNDLNGNGLNGKWFVVLGSGPTGPITGSTTTEYQFLGRSDQNLRVFVLDLKTGALQSGYPKDTLIPHAFAGSMLNSSLDADLDYQDDAVYIPYVREDTTAGTWTQGGVIRLLTRENTSPSTWEASTVIDNIGPVTSSVVRLQKQAKGILWLFFGTGRYYFERTIEIDDPGSATDLRKLFGIKDPCFSSSGFAASCPSLGSLTNVTDIAAANAISNPDDPSFKGWYINLDSPGTVTYCDVYNVDGTCAQSSTKKYRTERVITDTLSTTSGLVFFTTYKPYDDICALGGKSFIWAVKYSTGGAAGALLKGKGLVQVSTGSIEQVNLSTAFTEAGGRRTSAMEGVPPTAQGLSLLSTPPPVKRVIHIRER